MPAGVAVNVTRERRRLAGLCRYCDQPCHAGRSRCLTCIEADKAKARAKRAADVAHRQPKSCAHCGVDMGVDYRPMGGRPRKFCSAACQQGRSLTPRVSVPDVARACLHCGAMFTRPASKASKTCSMVCRYAYHRVLLTGKQYAPHARDTRSCNRCSRTFQTSRQTKLLCNSCSRAVSPNRDHGKPERRAKRAGVPYVYGIKPEKVFERDGWRCHLCGRKTPARLRGTTRPSAPEVDHIIPIAAGGGHTWDNVACACRSCNAIKSDRPLGQLRLAV